MRSWLRVLVVAGLAGALVFGALTFVPPRYAATAQLRLPSGAGVADPTKTVEALRSRELIRKFADEFKGAPGGALVPNDLLGVIVRAGGFARARPGETAEDTALAPYYRSLRIGYRSDLGAATIEFTATTPELAVHAANRYAELYLGEVGAETNAAPIAQTAEIARLTSEIAAVEAALEQARGGSDAASRDQHIGDLAAAVAQAELERGDAEARARAVRAMLDKGSLEAIPEVYSSAALHGLIAERVRAEVQKTAAERALPAGDPKIRELQAKLSELRWRMFREATSIADSLDIAARAAAEREAEARARLAKSKASAAAPTDAQGIVQLERELEAKRRALAETQARASDAAAATSAGQNASLLSPAQPSAGPVFPRKGPLALLAAVSTLLIGFVLVIARQLLNGVRPYPASEFSDLVATARDRADVRPDGQEKDTRDPLPADARPIGSASGAAAFSSVSSPADAARRIARHAAGGSGFRTLIAAEDGDGAEVAREIATALTASGLTCILVDWSPDGRGAAATLDLRSRPGLNDLLAGRATFDDVIMRLPDSDAHFMACGSPVPPSAPPVDLDWTNLLLDALDEAYDHIMVVARMEPARKLFEMIEGRFDAGLMISEQRGEGMSINAAPGVFLGFEVREVHVLQMNGAKKQAAPARRSKRGQRQQLVA